MAASPDETQEYTSQLADVEELLKESPNDESLLSLKSDLLELLKISGGGASDATTTSPAANEPPSEPIAADSALDQALKNAVGNSIGHGETQLTTVDAAVAESKPTPSVPQAEKKKKKVKAEFEIPKHLEISESDTTAEKNKKKRAIKALKSKWKESVKEAASEKKQQSWQSFQKKRKIKDDSIFKTGNTGAVGVVSVAGRKLTDFEDRKRHKR